MRQQARPGTLLGAVPEVIGPVQPPDRQAIRCLLSSQTYTGGSFEKCAQGNVAGSGVLPPRRERGVLQCHHRDDARSLFRVIGRLCETRWLLTQPPSNGQMQLQLNQAATCRVSDRFCSANDVHLSEDGFDVRFHCALTNKESRADLLITFALA